MKLFFCLIFLFSFYVSAQIVNIENLRLNPRKEGFSGNIDLSVNYVMNTVQLLQIGDRFRIVYSKQRHYYLLLTDHSLVQTKDVSIMNLGFVHFRYNYSLQDSGRVIAEGFQQAQFNKVQKINLRLLLGGGFRFRIIDQKNYQLNSGTGFMLEYEELIDYGFSNDILSNNYLSFDGQFNEYIGLNSITYFQPKLIDFGNYRMSNETQLRFKIGKHLTYRIVYSLTHDSRDIEGVRKTNYTFRNALSFVF